MLDFCVLAQHAHLEGEEETVTSLFNGDLLMANWYKIVLAVVLVACAIGLIRGNILYYVKRTKHKDS